MKRTIQSLKNYIKKLEKAMAIETIIAEKRFLKKTITILKKAIVALMVLEGLDK